MLDFASSMCLTLLQINKTVSHFFHLWPWAVLTTWHCLPRSPHFLPCLCGSWRESKCGAHPLLWFPHPTTKKNIHRIAQWMHSNCIYTKLLLLLLCTNSSEWPFVMSSVHIARGLTQKICHKCCPCERSGSANIDTEYDLRYWPL